MKKLLFLFILLLLPVIVLAEDFEYTIKSKVTLEGKELEGNDFTFDLYDIDGNLIQTKKNDKDGNITFDPISFTAEDATERHTDASTGGNYSDERKNKYFFYIIKQRNEQQEQITYDEETAYVGVYIYEDGDSRIDYLKDIERIKEETTKYEVKEGSQVYHATEEELAGQAYAVFDSDTKILTFFRDEEGKYTDQQEIGTKKYYTNFETGALYTPWANDDIVKIVFENPIKPKNISSSSGGTAWFSWKSNLEEIENINLLDTSETTSFNYLFTSDKKLTSLDLSTWDTSKVTDMDRMFYDCYELEEIFIDNFDTSNVTTAQLMFGSTYKLKSINQKVFNFPKLNNSDLMFMNSKTIQGLDTSTWNIQNSGGTAEIAYYMQSLVYLNVSTLPGLWSEAIGSNPQIAILDLAGEYSVVYSNIGLNGAYWYNLKTHTLYTKNDLDQHLVRDKDLEPATYVSPRNNPEPSLFRNLYTEPPKEPEKENPETGNYGLYALLILATISGIVLITQKKIDFLK